MLASMRQGLAIAAFALFAACAEASESQHVHYFPNGAFGSLDFLNNGWPDLFEEFLLKAHEPVLRASTRSFEARAVMITGFHESAIVRLERKGNHLHVVVKRYRRPNNTLPFGSDRFDASAEQLDSIVALATNEDFWQVSSNSNLVGTDATLWLVEVNDYGRYHVAYSVVAGNVPVYRMAKKIFSIAGISPPEQ
jgi:hypothetical protein